MTSRRVAVLTAILIGSFAITPAAHAATRTWNPSTNLMFGDFRFSNTQRWFPNGTLLPADDLQFTTGMNGSTSGVVNVAANQSLLVTNDISVIVAMESTHQYQLMSSLTVGAGGSGDESRLTLQGGQTTVPTVVVGSPGHSTASAALRIGGTTTTPSKIVATNVYVGGSSSAAGLTGSLEIDYGSVIATGSLTVHPPGSVAVSSLHGTLVVDSANPSSAPTLATSVGWSGTGQLTVLGLFDTPRLNVGRNAGSNGVVIITDAPSSDVSLGIVDLANAGTAALNLTNAVVDTDDITMGVGGTLSMNASTLGASDADIVIRGNVNATVGESRLTGATEFRGATVVVSSGATLRVSNSLGRTIKYNGGSYTGAGTLRHASDPIEFTSSTTIAVSTFYVGASTITVPNNVVATINSQSTSLVNTGDFSGNVNLRGGVWDVSLEGNREWQLYGTVQMQRPLATTPVMRGSSPMTVFGRINSEAEGRIECDVVNQLTGVIQGPTTGSAYLRLTGDVSGRGNYEGNIAFAGEFSPGASAAQISFARNLRFESTSSLVMEIVETMAGTEYDKLLVTATAELDGELIVTLDAFEPELGDSFTLISAATLTGVFDHVELPSLEAAWTWQLDYNATSLVLTVAAAGDFNGDGAVDGSDFLAWQRGESPNPMSVADLETWRSRYGAPLAAATGSTVPEPSAGSLALWILAVLFSRAERTVSGTWRRARWSAHSIALERR
jgi:hypothetical protein